MKFYFEKISNIQCKYMVFYLNKLNNLLAERNLKVKIIIHELNKLFPMKKFYYLKNGDILEEKFNNNWQFLFAVFSRSESQKLLFKDGIETGITKIAKFSRERENFFKKC